ncbi:MAG: adenosylmethionine--8-amino-7-oxononanoate transaminase [Flavobacteriales bacterium]|nr:adenosylmethionine--8-amino-7-oxononanoate transaminase [Flavobacteriales bacterium]
MDNNLVERDLKTIWHPYTQMKLNKELIPIIKGEREFLIRENGDRIIDAISSWWVNIHGHANPIIAKAIADQAKELEQVIFAGFTHEPAVRLAEALLDILPSSHSKIFYSDNGSTAVEVAIKLALQYFKNDNKPKNKLLAIEGAYHGDTFGAMSVSARGAFNEAFHHHLFDVDYLPFPEEGKEELCYEALRKSLREGSIAGFIYEPLVQGAAGMRMYKPEVLEKMLEICQEFEVITIADEVMTGFGRTGKNFASEYVSRFEPDIICMSKGITGGFMPLGTTSCKEFIYERFYSDDKSKTFYHGHSFTANSLSCAASIASISILKDSKTQQYLKDIAQFHETFKPDLQNFDFVQNVKSTGTILSFEFVPDASATSYFNKNRNEIYEFFMQRNILIRPLGNVIYLIPPYCISGESLKTIKSAILEFLNGRKAKLD